MRDDTASYSQFWKCLWQSLGEMAAIGVMLIRWKLLWVEVQLTMKQHSPAASDINNPPEGNDY